MPLITGIEAQPNFPHEDLTDDNAAMLELLLSNLGVVTECHSMSESTSWVLKVGHLVVGQVAQKVLERDGRLEALDHGAVAYEALSMLLSTEPVKTTDLFAVHSQVGAWTTADTTKAIGFQQEAVESFQRDLPKTKEVIASSAARFFPHFTSYALLGAAMTRQFELDCVDA